MFFCLGIIMLQDIRVNSTPFRDHSYNPTNLAPVSITNEVISNMQRDVIVLDRNNIPMIIRGVPTRLMHQPSITIRRTYRFLTFQNFRETYDFMSTLHQKTNIFNNEFQQMYDECKVIFGKQATNAYIVISMDQHILLDDLVRHGGCIYETASDLTICLHDHWTSELHPRSPEYNIAEEAKRFTTNRLASGIMIELVDNDSQISDRFIYCAKQLVKVSPCTNPTMANGVYMTVVENSIDGKTNARTVQMTYEQASTDIGLHRTIEEAISDGSPEQLIKLQEQQIQNERITLKRDEVQASSSTLVARRELEIFKEEMERKMAKQTVKEEKRRHKLEKKREKEKRKSEKLGGLLEKIKMKSMKMKEKFSQAANRRSHELDNVKDYYERRSYDRKDTSETFKFIPTLIAGAVGIFALFKMAG